MHQPATYVEHFESPYRYSREWLFCVADSCEWCGASLDRDEAEYPRIECGDVLCDECYREHYTYVCHWCEEDEANEHKCTIGSLFAVFEPVPAMLPGWSQSNPPEWYDIENREMLPGLYRITERPILLDSMLNARLLADSFEWVAELPQAMQDAGGYAGYSCGPLCRECQANFTPEVSDVLHESAAAVPATDSER